MNDKAENYFRYIPVRQRDVQWGLFVTGAGYATIAPHVEYPPKQHPELYNFNWSTGRTLPEYQVIYISQGSGTFESAVTGKREITPGTIVLLFPGVWHRYRPNPATGWKEWWVSFNGGIMDQLVERQFFSANRALLPIGLEDTLLTSYMTLLHRLQTDQEGFPHLMAADVMEILATVASKTESDHCDLISRGPQNVIAVQDRLVAEAMRLIWEQSLQPMTIDGLVRKLPVTRRSLERRFLSTLGHGIYEEIIRCRMERAKRLLAATTLSLKEVALAAGFQDADSLGRTFRRVEGVTPTEYRRSEKH